jgi:hypothetical protein
MNSEEVLCGTPEEAAELVQALNALRDVLNTTSLYLKDIQSAADFASQGLVREQACAVLNNLRQTQGPYSG